MTPGTTLRITRDGVTADTPMGANLHGSGATFRVWAPRARAVHVVGRFAGVAAWQPLDGLRLVRDDAGYWSGFLDGAGEGDQYKFYVTGEGSTGYKRDPYARELSSMPAYPHSNCVIRDPASYSWHDAQWRTPPFNELVIYQFHVGTYGGRSDGPRPGTFLDLLDRFDHLVGLGVNAVEPLPIVEFNAPRSMGYDGSDIYSPEMDYTLEGDEVRPYLPRVNALLARCGCAPLTFQQLAVPINQLKLLVDLCHVHGIAVVLDVVYNHAGSDIGSQDESLWFFDRWTQGDPNESLYFTRENHVGPVFAFWKREVRQFLIDNAAFFVNEYHVDGLRYDQTSVIVAQNAADGWRFCQDCTGTVRGLDASACQIAEYWPVDPRVTVEAAHGGAGFDAAWTDGIRTCVRDAIRAASAGREQFVDLGRIARAFEMAGFERRWKGVQYVESHDEVYRDRGWRLPRLADPSDARSWYARSRARVASALMLTAPGIPLIFMGQEFLEDRQWSDDPAHYPNLMLDWDGLGTDRAMSDHLKFFQDLVRVRKRRRALCGEGLRIIVADEYNRVLAFQRWVEGAGEDCVVVASLNEATLHGYRIGMPQPGRWLEAFNSDYYDRYPNPAVSGNGGAIQATDDGNHGFQYSAGMTIPANGVLIFSRG